MNPFASLDRRQFLIGSAAMVSLHSPMAMAEEIKPLKIGLISDPHHGLATDAQKRLESFMEAVESTKPDVLIQMGDFCHPPRAVPTAADFLKTFNQFKGPRYHVVGNHDLDLAKSKQEILDAWETKQSYYSFDAGGFHFAILDCNFVEKDGKFFDWKQGFRYEGRVHPEQIDWLETDLKRTQLPIIIISHQGFTPKEQGGVVPDGEAIRKVIESAKSDTGRNKVILCLHGHNHLDGACRIHEIDYVQLNSASYLWVGEKYGRMAAYRDSLYAFLTLDPRGKISLQGKESEFVAPTPKEREYPLAEQVSAKISDREWKFTDPKLPR